MPIHLSLSLSALIFGILVVAQAWVLGENPGSLRLLASVIGWMSFAILSAGFFVGVAYSFDVTEKRALKARFSRYMLIATALLAFGLAVSIASDAPPPFLGAEPEETTR